LRTLALRRAPRHKTDDGLLHPRGPERNEAMATIRAILIRKTDEGQSVGLADFD